MDAKGCNGGENGQPFMAAGGSLGLLQTYKLVRPMYTG